MKPLMLATFVIISLVFSGCSGQTEPAYTTVSGASISIGEAIPTPTGEVVLTISGNITVMNQAALLVFDMETLEMLGLVEYRVKDPWLNRNITYKGVLLGELLKYAGIADAVQRVRVRALDGYAADVPLTEFEKWPVLLATQADGKYMSIENNGPTRIIFPYEDHDDITAARNMSVWNVEAIEVK